MDYRLDLFNAVNNYIKEMTEDEAIFFMAFNSKDKDLMLALDGNIKLLVHVMSNLEINSGEEESSLEKTKSMVLNIAINILNNDKSLMDKFQIALKSIDNHIKEDKHQIN